MKSLDPFHPFKPFVPFKSGGGGAPVVSLVSIAVTPAAGAIINGGTQQFTATGTYSNSSTADITATVTWASSNNAVTTITAGGLATGVASGVATISATLGAVSGNTTLTVIAILVSIAVTPAAATINDETTQQFTATGTYSDSSTENLTGTVTWASSNASVATISSGGLATGAFPGQVTISATLGAVSGNTTLNIAAVPIFSRDFTVAPLTLGANATFTRASTAFHTQPGGILRDCLAHESRWAGARRVRNRFNNITTWNSAGVTGADATYGVADPDGGNRAVRLAATVTTFYLRAAPTVVAGEVLVNSFYMRRVAGAGNIKIYYPNSSVAGSGILSVDSTWRRYSGTATAVNTSGYTGPNVTGATIGVDIIEIYFPQLELGTVPSEPISAGVPTSEELCVNGGFDTDTVWTKGAGITITGGKAVFTASTGNLELPLSSFTPKIGKTYSIEFDGTASSGTIRAYIGGTACGSAVSLGVGHIVVTGVAANTTGPFYIDAVSAWTGTIDNISIKECNPGGANVDGVKYFGTANGNSVNANNVVTEATGTALSGPFTLLREPAETNNLIYSNDLSNAAWIKDRCTGALTATDPTGAANSASLLTATNTDALAWQKITATAGSRKSAIWMRSVTGTGAVSLSQGLQTGSELVTNGTFDTYATGWTIIGTPTVSIDTGRLKLDGTSADRAYQGVATTIGKVYRVKITQTNGTAAASLRIGTAENGTQYLTQSNNLALDRTFVAAGTTMYFSLRLAATGTAFWDDISVIEVVETAVTLTSNWAQVSTPSQSVEADPTIGIHLATSGDAVEVWAAKNSTATEDSSPIVTTTAAVTRAVDALSYSGIAAHNETDIVYSTGTVKVPNFSAVPTPTSPVLISSITAYTEGEHWNLGPELVTNGTFNTDATGWTAQNSSVLSVTDGVLVVTNAGANFGQAVQTINLEIGSSYVFRVDCKGTSGVSHRIFWDLPDGVYFYNNAAIASPAEIKIATGASTTIALRNGTASAGWSSYDNVSVRKILL